MIWLVHCDQLQNRVILHVKFGRQGPRILASLTVVILLFVTISENSPYYFEWGRPVPRKSVTIRECFIKRSDIKRSWLFVASYLVWKDILCFIIFHTKMECICRWKFIKNVKGKKWNIPITRTKQVQLFWNDNENVTFHELKSTLIICYYWLHICGVLLVFLLCDWICDLHIVPTWSS